jgi:hypothetical protein
MPNPLVYPLLRWARRLRFPRLLAITGTLFALTLVIPDPLPLVDELLLGLATLVLVNWKRDRAERAEAKRSGQKTGNGNQQAVDAPSPVANRTPD